MYNRVLVVSDNNYLIGEIKLILQENGIINLFDFATSPSNKKKPENNCDPFIVDFKNEDDVNLVIETYDLLISIHCKQIFPKKVVNSIPAINLHPGYNPINRGWYPQVFAIENQLPVGATIHEIDEHLDNGPIIDREFVKIENTDTSGSVYKKILKKEIELFKKNILSIIHKDYKTSKPESEGNLFLKKDFDDLCEIDLFALTTAFQLIKRLRALTHDDFKNAYFFDPETNEKFFISISLTK